MASEFDTGVEALDALIEWERSAAGRPPLNEADTRFHLIDHLLRDVLRWPEPAFSMEKRTEGGDYIDYLLGAPGPRLVLEAKREGLHFVLPAGVTAGTYKIRNLVQGSAGRPLKDAMEQVAAYAAQIGVAPAGVCNGHQLVVFLATRMDGVPPMDGQALVFPSLEEMRTSFRDLWDSVSPVGVETRNIFQRLSAAAPSVPEPLSAALTNYPGVKRRNTLQAGLEILGELFLEDIAKLQELRADFLEECYATSGALSQYAQVSKNILQTRYALLDEQGGVGSAASVTSKKQKVVPELTQDMLAAAASRRPIILLGDVGAGKSTFIQRLVHVEARELFEAAITLYVDFGASSSLASAGEHVVDSAIDQLRERYEADIDKSEFVEAVYRSEIRRFEGSVVKSLRDVDPSGYTRERVKFLQGLVGDRGAHLARSLEHITATWHRQVVIFLDNIDQRSAEDQNAVFLIANDVASNWPATVFVTLRPETFFESSRAGAVSGYHPRVFTIAPPRADVMLQRRVAFALNQLRSTGRLGSFPVGVTVDSESLESFLEILGDNFRYNQPLLSLIDNLAGGNMRMALQFVTDFIGSGHIDTGKMIEIHRVRRRYTIPVHEFLRSLMFGDANYYNPAASEVSNVLRIVKPDGREHFLVPLLLAHAQALGERVVENGYVEADKLHAFGHSLGFDEDQIAEALRRCVAGRLLQRTVHEPTVQARLQYRITTVGAYHLRSLLTLFTYHDAIVVDTPIVDRDARADIGDAFALEERVERVERFRAYLDGQWQGFDPSGLPWDWTAASRALGEDAAEVKARGAKALARATQDQAP